MTNIVLAISAFSSSNASLRNRAPLICAWIATGNPRQPLVCRWAAAPLQPVLGVPAAAEPAGRPAQVAHGSGLKAGALAIAAD